MRKTLRWLWGMIFNPELVWLNEDGTYFESEKVTRFPHGTGLSRWDLRPYWFHTFLATKSPCGCVKRFGIWHTIWCMDCSAFDMDDPLGDDQ